MTQRKQSSRPLLAQTPREGICSVWIADYKDFDSCEARPNLLNEVSNINSNLFQALTVQVWILWAQQRELCFLFGEYEPLGHWKKIIEYVIIVNITNMAAFWARAGSHSLLLQLSRSCFKRTGVMIYRLPSTPVPDLPNESKQSKAARQGWDTG